MQGDITEKAFKCHKKAIKEAGTSIHKCTAEKISSDEYHQCRGHASEHTAPFAGSVPFDCAKQGVLSELFQAGPNALARVVK
jgi:hypothetical protein